MRVDVVGGSTISGRLAGLRGDVAYDVTVVALSPGGNPSAPSNVMRGTPTAPPPTPTPTPTPTQPAAGGGCSSGPGTSLALLGAALAAALARGRARVGSRAKRSPADI